AGRSMGSETEGKAERVQSRPPPTANHVESSEVRRARMDCVLLSKSSHATPRSASYSRPKTARSQSARPPRSNSANRLREQAEADDKEKRAMAEAAFQAWIKRKAEMPRQPRASPSREQIEQYTKEDKRQRVLNQWHLRGVQRTKPETRSPSSPKENGSD
ncbi:hypothetical protein PRIPAC_96943, partial [Pristionchus pacificus]|uniref:Uncharacterized protein n=1 Tax=Pristionchus pacificus TaxID=54126 RepID=A0A8R1V276_PRIPA